MSNKEIELTAYCGLYCGDCIRYKSKFADLARDLSSELQRVVFDKYAEAETASVKEFGHYDEFRDVLDAIVKLKCDAPCRAGGDGCLQPCVIKACVRLKGIEGCWECDEFEACGKFEFLKPLHGDTPRKNLGKIKEHGLAGWVEHRGRFYLWL